MKKKHIFLAGTLLFASLTMNSCLDFDDPGTEMGINNVQTSTTQHSGNVDSIPYLRDIPFDSALVSYETLHNDQLLQTALGGIYSMRGSKDGNVSQDHAYQMQYCLGTDGYAQYFVVPHRDFPYSEEVQTSTYNIAPKFNGGAGGVYSTTKLAMMPLLNHPAIDNLPEIKAIFLLYYSIAAQEMADLFGPFTYLEDKKNLEEVTEYNDVKTIYYGIVDNIDTIVECLKHFENRPQEYKELIQAIMIYFCKTNHAEDYSSMDSYIRLANSLKLRMAMHIVKVEPATAQRWAEEAVASGVIEDMGQQHGIFPKNSGMSFTHPLVTIASGWNDIRISASFESLLMSLDHPYTKYFILPNSYAIKNKRTGEEMPANTRICGLRAGTLVGIGQYDYDANKYLCYSSINTEILKNSNNPKYFIKWAEVDLLRAEGAIRGWKMDGDAQTFYERGIRNAFMEEPTGSSQYSSYVNDYLQLETAKEYTSVDPLGEGPDWPSLTKIGVKWNEGDENEIKLEKIITQKYLALFPLSSEAWTELRRTGYPKLFPVLNTDEGDGSINEGEMIRRIPWVPSDPIALGMVEASGVPALGGPDEQATRLWWDVDAPNF